MDEFFAYGIKTPKQFVRVNVVCEPFIGSLERECLDYILILPCLQLHCLVREYVAHYNQARPLQGIEQQILERYEQDYPLATSRPVSLFMKKS